MTTLSAYTTASVAGEAGTGGTVYRLYGDKLEHVVARHAAGTASSGSKFPANWGTSQIVRAAEFVANNPRLPILANTNNRAGFIKIGEYGGIVIRSVVQYDPINQVNRIITSFPIK